ncbi:MAG: hypothetical protein EOP00_26115 [Pedobacter sp.]|nr:MAG: hypothetical protein EOP00_26115 [Pedobacter sp.]
MKKLLTFLLLFFITLANAQERIFQNQGEQEDYWTEELFRNEYVKQSFERFKGKVTVIDKNTVTFDNKTLTIWAFEPALLEILTEGIFYPQILIGSEENQPIKNSEELKMMSVEERISYKMTKNDSLKISDFEEVKFLSKSPKVKRFRFWNFRSGFANPMVYFIELTNEDATETTDLKTFIKSAQLTFVKSGWLIL